LPTKTENKFRYSLRKVQCKVTVGDDLGKCFGIKDISDFDKSNIRQEAARFGKNIDVS
jgi:hypothetical protein